MNTALWIVQALLSAIMLVIGLMKTFQPIEQLSKFSWTTRRSKEFIRFIGISELLISAGLVVPWLTGMLPKVTYLAAADLCIIMVLAIIEHVRYKETSEIAKNVVILLLAAFVAVERWVPLEKVQ